MKFRLLVCSFEFPRGDVCKVAVVVFAASVAKYIPLAVLSSILLVVSYRMGDWDEIPELLKLSRLEIGTWLLTFGLTVFGLIFDAEMAATGFLAMQCVQAK